MRITTPPPTPDLPYTLLDDGRRWGELTQVTPPDEQDFPDLSAEPHGYRPVRVLLKVQTDAVSLRRSA